VLHVRESSRRPDPALRDALALAREVLAAEPAGLLTDFDGTLSPIVEDPATARLADGATEALTALAHRLAVVAIVTGRAPLDARRMTGVAGLLVAGNHGTEWLEPDADAPASSSETAAARERIARILGRVPPAAGVSVEDKGVSATVHYRTAPDPEAARRSIVEAIGEPGEGVELRPGRMSVEIRPVGLGDKGAATRQIVERFGLRGAVVMGDDVTDLDMFDAIAALREAGMLRAAIVAVGGTDREVPSELSEAADCSLAGPTEAALLLGRLAG
jgi:trehalose 6-phosphate phosphatase